jgi:hypothetical protein
MSANHKQTVVPLVVLSIGTKKTDPSGCVSKKLISTERAICLVACFAKGQTQHLLLAKNLHVRPSSQPRPMKIAIHMSILRCCVTYGMSKFVGNKMSVSKVAESLSGTIVMTSYVGAGHRAKRRHMPARFASDRVSPTRIASTVPSLLCASKVLAMLLDVLGIMIVNTKITQWSV